MLDKTQQIELSYSAELRPQEKGVAIPHAAARKRRVGRFLPGLGALLVLSGGVGYGAWRHQQAQAEVMATAEATRNFVPAVLTGEVRASGATHSATWPATIQAFDTADIYARASGYILKRNVDIGSRVKKGDLLVEITAPELDHQISQAEATLAQMEAARKQAEANRDLASVTWTRDSRLVNQGWVTLQQGDTDRLTLAADEAAVGVAEANAKAQRSQIGVLQQQKDYQSVTAPFNGVITQRNVDIGDLVQANANTGADMFTLMDDEVVRIQLYVPQDEALGIVPDVEATVRVPEMPGRTFPGKVTRIADALQVGTRTLQTEIDVPNPEHLLTPGLYCTVELKIPRVAPSLIVPAQAIIFNSDGVNVAVVDHGVARIHHITETRDLGTTVEVSSGVTPGDKVILNPPVDLADGSKVSVRTPGPLAVK
ncbi:MAG: efflux RND transporter periplasmic adaptor subunit, partial [Roseiarcus sp.]